MLAATQIPVGLSLIDNVLGQTLKAPKKASKPNPGHLKVANVKFIPLDELKLLRGVKDGLLGARSSCPNSRANSYRESARTLFRWAKRWKNNDIAPPKQCHKLMERAMTDVHLDSDTGFLAGSLLRMGTYYGMFAGGTARNFHAKLEALDTTDLPQRSQERIRDLLEDTARYF